jgi:hypothetical protein
MTQSSDDIGWPPEVVGWRNGEPVTVAVLSQLGRMRDEFPTAPEVKHAARRAAFEYVGSVEDPALQDQRLDDVVDALRLEVRAGSTRQRTALEFIAASDTPYLPIGTRSLS